MYLIYILVKAFSITALNTEGIPSHSEKHIVHGSGVCVTDNEVTFWCNGVTDNEVTSWCNGVTDNEVRFFSNDAHL